MFAGFRQKRLPILFGALLGFAAATTALAPAHADDTRVGGEVRVTGTVNDNLNVMAGDIDIDAQVLGDLRAVGGDITVKGSVSGEADVIGGDIDFDATVGEDLSIAGGDVRIGSPARIKGDLEVAGGEVRIGGTVERNVEAAAADFKLTGTVNGDVDVRGVDITIAPGARIAGDLIAKGPQEPTINGTVEGEVKYTRASGPGWRGYNYGWDGDFAHHFDFEITVLSSLWALFGGFLLIFLFPKLTDRTARTFQDYPVRSFGFGLLSIILLPVLAILLIVTIIGLPLGLLILLFYPLLLFIGFLSTALGLARMAYRDSDVTPSKLTQLAYLAVVLLTLTILSTIPVLNSIITILAVIIGIGAFGAALFNYDESKPSPQSASAA